MNNFDKVKQKLEESKVKYYISEEETDSLSVDEQIKAKKMKFKQGMSTLVFNVDKEYLIVIFRRDDRLLDKKPLMKKLNAKSIEFGKEQDIKELGFKEGLVSPVIIPYDIKVFIDSKVLEMDEIICGAAAKGYYLHIKKDDLLKLLPEYEVFETKPNPKRQDKREIKRVLHGITPSGESLHIGNYFGAVYQHLELQKELKETYYFIADLHALTTVQNREELEKNEINVILDYLALGIDPQKSVFFRQSDVPAHSQLAVILGNYISYGQMKRMHAFKDKLEKGASVESVNMGLFNYPILMASDILLYKPDAIPVGEDQRQHVELTRDIAESFNSKYKTDLFPLPDPMIRESKVGRVVGTEGKRKMSKSLNNVVGIFDDEALIRKQIMGAYTDPNRIHSTDPGKVEGNTVFVYHDLINDNKEEVDDLKNRYREGKVGDVEVKEKLVAAHSRYFKSARERRKELEKDINSVREIMLQGAEKAKEFADKTLEEVYETIGLKLK